LPYYFSVVAAKYAPKDGKKLLIIGQDLGAVGGLDDYTTGYVDEVGHIPAGVTSYTSLPSLSGLKNKANWGSGDVKAQAYLENETFNNSFIVIGLYLVNQLQAIANGNHDAKIKELAEWIKAQNRPVFIRFGYEFEGPWNNYNPEQFKTAWKHFVHIFDDEKVRNAVYVWQSAGLNKNNIANWYPGDEYVNWMAYSHFDSWNPGQSIRDFAEARNKPVMIAEATPRRDLKEEPGESHWLVWYSKLFESICANDRVKALAYINVDWDSQPMWNGQGWGDSRVQANPYVLEQWNIEMEKDAWIMASDTLLQSLDHQMWLTVATNDFNLPANEIDWFIEERQLHITNSNHHSKLLVKIFDTTGKIVLSDKIEQPNKTINLNMINRGVYILYVERAGKVLHWKIVVP